MICIATLFPSTATSTLLFLTPDSSAVTSLPSLYSEYGNYTLAVPSLPAADKLRQWWPAQDAITSIQSKFEQNRFNKLEDLKLRITLARYYVRDLTVMALYADAFLVSGKSSTGQLACLIAGEDAVVGPRGISGKGLGGRVRSIDEPWRPVDDQSMLWPSS
jgi:hypothetical protein